MKNIGDRVIVSWQNAYGANISTINIQRSRDSIRNFITIGSVLEPMNRENGFVDDKAVNPNMFYRVFVAFEGGRYVFSKSYRPVKDSGAAIVLPDENRTEKNPTFAESQNSSSTFSSIVIPPPPTTRIKTGTKLLPVPPPLPLPPPLAPKYLFAPSKFIYAGRDNNIIIELTTTRGSRFSVKFYDEKDNMIFEIKKIAEPYLIIEKVNFKHAGWFYFRLFENGILKEKNQFYIPKEGKTGIPPTEMSRQFR